ncbi:TetR/AcrR family transcriptional regulator [bacterium]|nr:TetR/AcrR family transcriptional regulator [bacterium]
MPRSTNAAAPRRRGRPRQFEYDAALDAALRAFWERGYAGTSIDHLTAAMGLNRPSLYAAFGNKDAVYAAAIAHYVDTVGRAYVAALNRPPALADALTAFFAAVIDVATGRHGPTGCALACTLPAEAGASPVARAQLARAFAQVDRAIAARLETARAAGQLAASADVRALAQLIAGTMFAIAIRARAGASRAELRRVAGALVALLTGAARRR